MVVRTEVTGIQLVQVSGISGPFGNYAGITATLSSVSAGDMLALAVEYNSLAALPASVSDTSGNTWHFSTSNAQNPPLASNSSTQNTALVAWALSVSAAASVTVTLSWGSNENVAFAGSLSEWSGVGSETTGVSSQQADTQVHLPSTSIPLGGLVVAASVEQFTSSLVPTAPLTAFSADATGYSAYALTGPLISFAPDWGNATHPWVAAAAVFSPATVPSVTLRAIDGGTGYYAGNGFTDAANAGWDSASFFPIGDDYCFYPAHSTTTFFDLGLNFTHRVTSDVDMSVLRAAGVIAWQGTGDSPSNTGTETVAWHIEEPGGWTDVQSQAGIAFTRGLSGRFLQVSCTYNQFVFGPPSGTPGGTMQAFMSDAIDTAGNAHLNIPGDDIYWFAGSQLSGVGSVPYICGLVYNTGGTPTADQCARGCHYGDMVDFMRAWLTVNPAPVIAPYIETEDGLVAGGIEITPPEFNWAVWSTIVHGARGLLYFGTTSNFGSGNTFGFSQSILSGQSISMYNQAKATNALVTQLAPVINSPFADYYFSVTPFPSVLSLTSLDSGIDAMAKYYASGGSLANGYYIFATTRASETDVNISATFTTADGYSGAVTVFGESRTVTATGGVFSDVFATGATVHIYQIPFANSGSSTASALLLRRK